MQSRAKKFMFLVFGITTSAFTCELEVTYKLVPNDVREQVAIIAASKSYQCDPISQGACIADLDSNPRSVVVRIEASGYRIFRRTFLDVTCLDARSSQIGLGEVKLSESDLPRVSQVIEAHDEAGNKRFQLVLANRTKRRTLLKRVVVVARRPIEGPSCLGPTPNYFEVSGNLTLIAGDSKSSTVVGAMFSSPTDKHYVVDIQGLLDHDACEHRDRLILRMPAAVDLPPGDFATLTIVLPSEFRLAANSNNGWYPSGRKTVMLTGFTSFSFALSSDDPDASDIIAAYPGAH
jgi:hypothetical protein